MNRQTVISTKHLKKSFGQKENIQTIYSDLNIDIYKGDFTVIMGSSGAGKSTLMYSLSGMDKPDGGQIDFDGTDIKQLNSDKLAVFRRSQCGFVFQQIYLMDGMSVMDNVLAAGLLVHRDKKVLVEKAEELLEAVGISEETRRKFPAQISGGEAQRAGIVRGLINSPEILFADEPTGALNSKTGLDVLNMLTKFNEQGQSVVMVTHDMRSARRGNRILYLKDGVILGECKLGKYVHGDRERHEKLSAFLGEMGW